MNTRKSIDALAATLMVCLCMTWGGQQVALKAAATDVPPILQLALRSGIAAILVGIFMALRHHRINLKDRHWRPGIIVGILFAMEFLFVGEGLRYTTASHMVVFLYTAPIFAAVGLHLKLPIERLHLAQWIGVALAFTGIVTAFLGRAQPVATGNSAATHVLFGDFLGLLAALSWAATTVVVRTTSLSHTSASETLLYQLISGFVLLLAAAFLLGQAHFNPTPLAWGTLAFQAIIVSFISFLTWFWLLRHYLASQLGVLSFMTPLFGVLFGVLLLKEPLDPSFLTGATLVLAGIILVSGYRYFHQLFKRKIIGTTDSAAPTRSRTP